MTDHTQQSRQHLEIVNNLIGSVRILRLSVTELFSTLADNGPLEQESRQSATNSAQASLEEHLMLIGSNHHVNCKISLPDSRIVKQQDKQSNQDLVHFVSGSISKIFTILKTLDEGVDMLMATSLNVTLGESAHLGHDLVSERNNLYIDMCKTLKMYDNMHDYSLLCHQLLQQQSLRRSFFFAYCTKPDTDYKYQRRALFNPYIHPQQLNKAAIGQTPSDNLKDLINHFAKQHPTMEVQYSTPFGMSTGILQLSLNKILKAVLVLRGRVLDALIIKAHHESFAVSGSQEHVNKSTTKVTTVQQQQKMKGSADTQTEFVDPGSEVDIWSESKYLVFRKITQQANMAMLHFQYPQNPQIALKTFLVSI